MFMGCGMIVAEGILFFVALIALAQAILGFGTSGLGAWSYWLLFAVSFSGMAIVNLLRGILKEIRKSYGEKLAERL